jgi:GLPGLI family protein
MRNQFVVIALAVIFLATSCGKTDKSNAITSGRIDYKITYLNTDIDKKTQNILPTRMKLMFNEKIASNNIEGFMGIYKLHAVTNFHTRKCSTVLKVFEKQYLFKGSRDEQMCCFDNMEGMVIKWTDETKMIAGFNCKKCIIRLPETGESIDVYYTEEIDLKHPNSTNPYKEIKGVLMEFELKLSYLRMRFVAEKYQPIHEVDITPRLPSNIKQVSRDQMTQILNKLME